MPAAKVLIVLSIVLCIGSAVGLWPLWVSVLTLGLALIVS
jgi:hypothetical protein